MKSIILTDEEKELYNSLMQNIPIFLTNEKDNLTNLSPLFRLSLEQNSKYRSNQTIKTNYIIKKNYPIELKKIINLLNQSPDDTNRKEHLALKNILMNRYYNNPDTVISNYEEFMITAGHIVTCINCSGSNVTIENKNKRSADEPTETYYKCQDCKKEFKERIKLST